MDIARWEASYVEQCCLNLNPAYLGYIESALDKHNSKPACFGKHQDICQSSTTEYEAVRCVVSTGL